MLDDHGPAHAVVPVDEGVGDRFTDGELREILHLELLPIGQRDRSQLAPNADEFHDAVVDQQERTPQSFHHAGLTTRGLSVLVQELDAGGTCELLSRRQQFAVGVHHTEGAEEILIRKLCQAVPLWSKRSCKPPTGRSQSLKIDVAVGGAGRGGVVTLPFLTAGLLGGRGHRNAVRTDPVGGAALGIRMDLLVWLHLDEQKTYTVVVLLVAVREETRSAVVVDVLRHSLGVDAGTDKGNGTARVVIDTEDDDTSGRIREAERRIQRVAV